MKTTRLNEYKTVIPPEISQKLKLKPNDTINWEIDNNKNIKITIVKEKIFDYITGTLTLPKQKEDSKSDDKPKRMIFIDTNKKNKITCYESTYNQPNKSIRL